MRSFYDDSRDEWSITNVLLMHEEFGTTGSFRVEQTQGQLPRVSWTAGTAARKRRVAALRRARARRS